jgi:hypothetical protein
MIRSLSDPLRGYLTPAWAVRALLPHIQHLVNGLEPAAGQGGISKILMGAGMRVTSFDIYPYEDEDVIVSRRSFLTQRWDAKYKPIKTEIKSGDGGIVTHPPPHLIEAFIERALNLARPHGTVAFWLGADIDRDCRLRKYFAESDELYKKIIPVQRLRLSDDGVKPMAWYLWRAVYGGAPQLCYEIVGA